MCASVQLVDEFHLARSVMPERSLAALSCSLCTPSLMICCPYPGVFSGETEQFPSSIDSSIPPDRVKEAGDESPKGLFLERMC